MDAPGDAWAQGAAVRIAQALSRSLADAPTSRVGLALAGGSTPEPVYRWLVVLGGVPWDRVDVFFGDERAVPPDHPESNYRMAHETLLGPAGVDASRVFRMEAEDPDRAAAADRYAALLPERLSVLLLGVGEDGHTASLFPESPALDERRRRVADVPARGDRLARLTITPTTLSSAARIVVLARGEGKAAAVAQALQGAWRPRRCPAQLARHGTWLLDPAAATLLRPGPTSPSGRRFPPRA
jgi:6-phosphogluconolactonase